MAGARSPIVLLTLAIWAVVAAAADLSAGDRYALVIGVHQYDKNQLRSLPFAETDAVAVAEKLKAIGFRRVVLMTQSVGAKEARFLPTAANVRDAIDGFLDPRKWDEEDTAVIVLSGHGVQFRGQDVSYFCPMDTRLEKPETLVEIQEIYRKLEKCPAAFKLLIADCCRNDPQSDFSRARAEVNLDSVTRPQRLKPPGGVAAFFSCSAGEKAFESPELKKGIFTHFLLEALSEPKADLDKDGKVDLDELVRFTKRNVTDYVSDQFGERTIQVPEMVGKTRGIVPLVELAKLTPEKPTPPKLTPTPPKTTPGNAAVPGDGKSIVSKTTGMKLLLIPAGEYTRGSPYSDTDASGSEMPAHKVKITKAFYMGRTEVTQAEWATVMGTNPSWFSKTGGGSAKVSGDTSRYPVEYVSWYDAVEYCVKLSEKDGLPPYYRLANVERNEDKTIKKAEVTVLGGQGYRLPTEAEWEYAARAGKSTRFWFGDANNGKEANVNGNYPSGTTTKGPYLERTTTVGSYAENAFGLVDTCGNVWEWCEDWYDAEAYKAFVSKPAIDPLGDSSEHKYRVLRGGSWYFDARLTRSADRDGDSPDYRNDYSGFRLLRTP